MVPPLNLPDMQQQSMHLPMSAAVAGPSSAGGSSRYNTSTARSSSTLHSGAEGSLLVTPLTTTRGSSHGDGVTSRSSGGGPALSGRQLGPGRSTGTVLQCVQEAGSVPVSPAAAAAAAAAGDPMQAYYLAQVQKCALYMDPELHVMALELVLHLLVTPAGLLDAVQLPHEPSGGLRCCKRWGAERWLGSDGICKAGSREAGAGLCWWSMLDQHGGCRVCLQPPACQLCPTQSPTHAPLPVRLVAPCLRFALLCFAVSGC